MTNALGSVNPNPGIFEFRKEAGGKKIIFKVNDPLLLAKPEERETCFFSIWRREQAFLSDGAVVEITSVNKNNNKLNSYGVKYSTAEGNIAKNVDEFPHVSASVFNRFKKGLREKELTFTGRIDRDGITQQDRDQAACAVMDATQGNLSLKSVVEITAINPESYSYFTHDNLSEFKRIKKECGYVFIFSGCALDKEKQELAEYSVWNDARNKKGFTNDARIFVDVRDDGKKLAYYDHTSLDELRGVAGKKYSSAVLGNDPFVEHAVRSDAKGSKWGEMRYVGKAKDNRSHRYYFDDEVTEVFKNSKVQCEGDGSRYLTYDKRHAYFSILKHLGDKTKASNVHLVKETDDHYLYYSDINIAPYKEESAKRNVRFQQDWSLARNYLHGDERDFMFASVWEEIKGKVPDNAVVTCSKNDEGSFSYEWDLRVKKSCSYDKLIRPSFREEAAKRGVFFEHFDTAMNIYLSAIWQDIENTDVSNTTIHIENFNGSTVSYYFEKNTSGKVTQAPFLQSAPKLYRTAPQLLDWVTIDPTRPILQTKSKLAPPETYVIHRIALNEIKLVSFEWTLSNIVIAICEFLASPFISLYSSLFYTREHQVASTLFTGDEERGSIINHSSMLSQLGFMQELFENAGVKEVSESLKTSQLYGSLLHAAATRNNEEVLPEDIAMENASLKERFVHNLKKIPAAFSCYSDPKEKMKFRDYAKLEILKKIPQEEGTHFLLPVGIGERENYAPHFLLFYRENGKLKMKHIHLSPFHLQNKFSAVTTHDLGGLNMEKFIDELISLQPEDSQTLKVPQNKADHVDKTLEIFIASQISEHNKRNPNSAGKFKQHEVVQEGSLDPWTLLFNTIKESHIVYPDDYEKQHKIDDLIGTKARFMRHYVNHLINFLEKNEWGLTTDEKIHVLKSIQHYAVQLKALLAEEVGKEGILFANDFTANLLKKIDIRLEEQNRILAQERVDQENLDGSVKLFSLNLEKPLEQTMEAQNTHVAVLKKPEPFSLPAKEMFDVEAIGKEFDKKLQKGQREELLNKIKAHTTKLEALIVKGKAKEAKMYAFALLRILPTPFKNNEATFWDTLSKDEVVAWSGGLYELSERFFEAALKSNGHPLSPEEAFCFNTVQKLTLLKLHRRYGSFFPKEFGLSVSALKGHSQAIDQLHWVNEVFLHLYETPVMKCKIPAEYANWSDELTRLIPHILSAPDETFTAYFEKVKGVFRAKLQQKLHFQDVTQKLPEAAEKFILEHLKRGYKEIVKTYVSQFNPDEVFADFRTHLNGEFAAFLQEEGLQPVPLNRPPFKAGQVLGNYFLAFNDIEKDLSKERLLNKQEIETLKTKLNEQFNKLLDANKALVIDDLNQMEANAQKSLAFNEKMRPFFTQRKSSFATQLSGLSEIYRLKTKFYQQKKEEIEASVKNGLQKEWEAADQAETATILAREGEITVWKEEEAAKEKAKRDLAAYDDQMAKHYNNGGSKPNWPNIGGRPSDYPNQVEAFYEARIKLKAMPEKHAKEKADLETQLASYKAKYDAYLLKKQEYFAKPLEIEEPQRPQWKNSDYLGPQEWQSIGSWANSEREKLQEVQRLEEITEQERELPKTCLEMPGHYLSSNVCPQVIEPRNREELAVERAFELQTKTATQLGKDQFLKEMTTLSLQEFGNRDTWFSPEIPKLSPETQAFIGHIARNIGVTLENYTETLYYQKVGLKGALDNATRKKPSEILLMKEDYSFTHFAAQPEVEKRRKECQEFVDEINADNGSTIPHHEKTQFLIGYFNRGTGLQHLGSPGFLKINYDAIFENQVVLNDQGYGLTTKESNDFCTGSMVSCMRKHDAMIGLLDNTSEHIEKFRWTLLGHVQNKLFAKNVSDEAARSHFMDQERIFLVPSVHCRDQTERLANDVRAFVLSKERNSASGTYCTHPSDVVMVAGSTAVRGKFIGQANVPLINETLADDGERQKLYETSLRTRDPTLPSHADATTRQTYNNELALKNRLDKESDKALNLTTIREFLLRSTAVSIKNELNKNAHTNQVFDWHSIPFVFKFIHDFPEELVNEECGEVVQHRLFSTFLQPGLLENGLKTNPQVIFDAIPYLQATISFFEKQKESAKNEGAADGGSRYHAGAHFLVYLSERIRTVLLDMKKRDPKYDAIYKSFDEALPPNNGNQKNTYKEKLLYYFGDNGGAFQKPFAIYLLEYYRDHPEEFTPKDWSYILQAQAIILQHPSEKGHLGIQTRAHYEFYISMLPKMDREIGLLSKDKRDAFLTKLAGWEKKIPANATWEKGSEYRYVLKGVDGKSLTTIDLSTGEGVEIAVEIENKGGLPKHVLEHPDYQFLFKNTNPGLALRIQVINEDVLEYRWRDKQAEIHYMVRYNRKQKTFQLFQEHLAKGKEKPTLFRFCRLSIDESFLGLSFNQNNARVEELISKKGGWVRLSAKGEAQTDHVYIAQEGHKIEKDPIRLHIRNSKIVGATVGEGRQMKWVVAGMAEKEMQLFPFKSLDNVLLLSSDGRVVDEIRFFKPNATNTIGAETYYIAFRRNENNRDEWDVINREGWQWQLKNTAHLEKQFGKNYRENSFHLVNTKTGEEEHWFFPFIATGTGKPGSPIKYMKSMVDFVDLLKDMFNMGLETVSGNETELKKKMEEFFNGIFKDALDSSIEKLGPGGAEFHQILLQDLFQEFMEAPFELIRALFGNVSEFFEKKQQRYFEKAVDQSTSIERWVQTRGKTPEEAEAIKAQIESEKQQILKKIQHATGVVGSKFNEFFKGILSPIPLKITHSGTQGSHAAFLYQAVNNSLTGNYATASDYLDRMVKHGVSNTEEEVEQLEYLITKVLMRDSLTQLVQGQLMRPTSISQTAFQLKLLLNLKQIAVRLEAQHRRPITNMLKKMLEGLSQDGVFNLPILQGVLPKGAKISPELFECVYMAALVNDYRSQLQEKGNLLAAQGLLLTREENVLLRSFVPIDLLKQLDPKDPHGLFSLIPDSSKESVKQVLSLIGLGDKKAVALENHFKIPTENEVRQLMRTITQNLNPNLQVDIRALHQEKGSYPKWETVVANFYSYINWIYHNKLKPAELSFLTAAIPLQTKHRDAVDIARRMLLLFYHQRNQTTYFEDLDKDDLPMHGSQFETTFAKLQELAWQFPNFAEQEENIRQYKKELSDHPSGFDLMKFAGYRLWGSARKWMTQQADHVEVGPKVQKNRGLFGEFHSQCKALLFHQLLCNYEKERNEECYITLSGLKKPGNEVDPLAFALVPWVPPNSAPTPPPVTPPPAKHAFDDVQKDDKKGEKTPFPLMPSALPLASPVMKDDKKGVVVPKQPAPPLSPKEEIWAGVATQLNDILSKVFDVAKQAGVSASSEQKKNIVNKCVDELKPYVFDLLDHENFQLGYKEFVETLALFIQLMQSSEGPNSTLDVAGMLRASAKPDFGALKYWGAGREYFAVASVLTLLKTRLSMAFTGYEKLKSPKKVVTPANSAIVIDPAFGNKELWKWPTYFNDTSKSTEWIEKWKTKRAIIRQHLRPLPDATDMEKHLYDRILRGVDISIEELREKCARSLRIGQNTAIGRVIDSRISDINKEERQLKKEIDLLVRQNGEALGILSLLGVAETVGRLEGEDLLGKRIFKLVLEKYRDGKITSQELNTKITRYLLASTERDQLLKAKETQKRMRAYLEELCKGIPQGIPKLEQQRIVQARADSDIQWLLMSDELFQFAMQGTDRLRYAVKKGDNFVLDQPHIHRRYLYSDFDKKQIMRVKVKETIEKMVLGERRRIVVVKDEAIRSGILDLFNIPVLDVRANTSLKELQGIERRTKGLTCLVTRAEFDQLHLLKKNLMDGALDDPKIRVLDNILKVVVPFDGKGVRPSEDLKGQLKALKNRNEYVILTEAEIEKVSIDPSAIAEYTSDSLSLAAFRKVTHQNLRFEKVRPGVGKSTNVFPTSTEIFVLEGSEPVLITTEELLIQMRDFLGDKAYIFDFNISFGLSPEDARNDKKVIEHLTRLRNSLFSLKGENRFPLTTPGRLAFIQNKRVELDNLVSSLTVGTDESNIAFQKLQLMNQISSYFWRTDGKSRVIFCKDEDTTRDISKEYNYAIGEKSTVDPIFYDTYENFVMHMLNDPDLHNLLMNNALRGVKNITESLTPALKAMFRDRNFWTRAGWNNWNTVDETQFIEYVTGKSKKLPDAIHVEMEDEVVLQKLREFDAPFWESLGFKDGLNQKVKNQLFARAVGVETEFTANPEEVVLLERFLQCVDFWKFAGGSLNKEEVHAYVLGQRNDLPSGTTHLCYLGALKTLLTKTFPAVYHINADMARGFDPINLCEVMPYSDGEPKPNHQFGVQFEYILHHLLHYATAIKEKGVDETLFLKYKKELMVSQSEVAISRFAPQYTWGHWSQALTDRANKLPGEDRGDIYKAFTSPECFKERCQFLRYLTFQSTHIKIYKQQVIRNSQDITLGQDVRMLSGTGKPFDLNLADAENDTSNEPDVITAQTLLAFFTINDGKNGNKAIEGMNLPVRFFSDVEAEITALIAHPHCRVVINAGSEMYRNRYERVVGKLRTTKEGEGRQFLYVDSRTGKRSIWNAGEDAIAKDYHADQVNWAPNGAVAICGPSHQRGIDFVLPKGKNDFGVYLVDLSTNLEQLVQALGRMRELGYGQQAFLAIDEKMAKRICQLTGKTQDKITIGDVIKTVIRKTHDDDKLRNVKAYTFKVKSHLKHEVDNVLFTPYDLTAVADPKPLVAFRQLLFSVHKELYIQTETIDWMKMFGPEVEIDRLDYAQRALFMEISKIKRMRHFLHAGYSKIFIAGFFNNNLALAAEPQKQIPQIVVQQINMRFNALLKGYERAEQILLDEFEKIEIKDKKLLAYLKNNLPEKIPADVDGRANTDKVVEQQRQMEQEMLQEQEQQREQNIVVSPPDFSYFEPLDIKSFLIRSPSPSYLAWKYTNDRACVSIRALKFASSKAVMGDTSLLLLVTKHPTVGLRTCVITQTDLTHTVGPALKELRDAKLPLPIAVIALTSTAPDWFQSTKTQLPLFLDCGTYENRVEIFDEEYHQLVLTNKYYLDVTNYTPRELALFMNPKNGIEHEEAFLKKIKAEKTLTKFTAIQEKLTKERQRLEKDAEFMAHLKKHPAFQSAIIGLFDKCIVDCIAYTNREEMVLKNLARDPKWREKLLHYLNEWRSRKTLKLFQAMEITPPQNPPPPAKTPATDAQNAGAQTRQPVGTPASSAAQPASGTPNAGAQAHQPLGNQASSAAQPASGSLNAGTPASSAAPSASGAPNAGAQAPQPMGSTASSAAQQPASVTPIISAAHKSAAAPASSGAPKTPNASAQAHPPLGNQASSAAQPASGAPNAGGQATQPVGISAFISAFNAAFSAAQSASGTPKASAQAPQPLGNPASSSAAQPSPKTPNAGAQATQPVGSSASSAAKPASVTPIISAAHKAAGATTTTTATGGNSPLQHNNDYQTQKSKDDVRGIQHGRVNLSNLPEVTELYESDNTTYATFISSVGKKILKPLNIESIRSEENEMIIYLTGDPKPRYRIAKDLQSHEVVKKYNQNKG